MAPQVKELHLATVRRRARRQGYQVRKSRVRNPEHPDYGMYILRYWREPVGEGVRCATLQEVDGHLD